MLHRKDLWEQYPTSGRLLVQAGLWGQLVRVLKISSFSASRFCYLGDFRFSIMTLYSPPEFPSCNILLLKSNDDKRILQKPTTQAYISQIPYLVSSLYRYLFFIYFFLLYLFFFGDIYCIIYTRLKIVSQQLSWSIYYMYINNYIYFSLKYFWGISGE